MKRDEFIEALDNGPVRCKVGSELKQYTRNLDLMLGDEDAQGFMNANKKVDRLTQDGAIGVWDFGTNSIIAILHGDVDTVIGAGASTPE